MNVSLLDLLRVLDNVFLTLYYNGGMVYSGYSCEVPMIYLKYPVEHMKIVDFHIVIITIV